MTLLSVWTLAARRSYKWLREGLIPASRLGKSWIISEDALQAALAPGSNRPLASAVVNQEAEKAAGGSAAISTQESRSRDAGPTVSPAVSLGPVERRTPVGRINVAVIGLGNCASLVDSGAYTSMARLMRTRRRCQV